MTEPTKWDFLPKRVEYQWTRGQRLPHLLVGVSCNGRHVGYAEIHMHAHRGKDKRLDVSFGFTGVVERMPDDD